MAEEAQQMIAHIAHLIRKPGMTLDENTPLVSSGLIDSMSSGRPLVETRRPHPHAHSRRQSPAQRSRHSGQNVRHRAARRQAPQITSGRDRNRKPLTPDSEY